ncbi:MAG: PDZ domain-containing protein [Clostridiales bacterium]|nr:PDZ domain-containing protein [Clostridiales bacterium]
MSKKISLGIAIALVLLTAAASVAITMSVSTGIYNKLIADLPGRAQMYSNMQELDELVRKEYYGKIEDNFLNSEISAGYIKGLNDVNSKYMTAEQYNDYKADLYGTTSSIGIKPALDTESGSIYIVYVYNNSPAKSSGLQSGDRITAIENEAVTKDNYSSMVAKLQGTALSSVNITYQRDGATQTVNVVKTKICQTVFYQNFGTTGYIRISDFYKATPDELAKAISALSKEGAKNLILDVRGTKTGLTEYAAEALDKLVPLASEGIGAVAKIENASGEVIETFTSDAIDCALPMAVLTNSETSGPAELFACDLRDFGKAQIIGVKTNGTGTMSKIFELKDGSAVLLTIGKITPYKSECYDGNGISPDYEVSLSKNINFELLQTADDEQLQFAINLFSNNSQQNNQGL